MERAAITMVFTLEEALSRLNAVHLGGVRPEALLAALVALNLIHLHKYDHVHDKMERAAIVPSPRGVPFDHWKRDLRDLARDILYADKPEDYKAVVSRMGYLKEESPL